MIPTVESAERQAEGDTGTLLRISRFTFKLGSLIFVLIGSLHTFVQLTDLSTLEVKADLEAIGDVPNLTANAWELWQGIGLLFGFYAIAIGLMNLASLRGRPTPDPDPAICVINVMVLVAVTAIGALYLGPLQLFGGPAGIVMFGLPIVAELQAR